MHPHTIDWLRNVELSADANLAQKRWSLAEKYAVKLGRAEVIKLLRLFLFSKPAMALVKEFTDELLALDPEFPVSGNSELTRVMAGLVMAKSVEKSSSSADAFSLGLRAARLNGQRGNPVVPAIAVALEEYVLKEASEQRPNDFEAAQEAYVNRLEKKAAALDEAEANGDAETIAKARRAYYSTLADQGLRAHLRQLAEESQFLWLAVGEFSPSLQKPVAKLTAEEYALVAAAEAGERVQILPPPAAVDALLPRMLAPCKSTAKKVTLADLVDATDANWRAGKMSATTISDCHVLVPVCTALEKMNEIGDGKKAAAAVANLCQGVKADVEFSPVDAARQFFAELVFLDALSRL